MTSTANGSPDVVLYARVSSKDQEREGFSIPAQEKLLREYAREHRLTIVREFVDVETAKQAGRAAFGEMLSFLRATSSCRTILVEKTDRLYRNIRDWVTVADLDLTVHLVKENEVISKDSRSSEQFMHGIKVLMAKNYVDNLSEEVKKGLREKAEQGHWPTVAPVGYFNNRETHRIDVDSDRGPLIAALFEQYASGQYSLKGLTAKAHALGLTHPRSGRRMMKAEIHRILQNPIYMGNFRWLGKLHAGSHRPLITAALFADVQAILHGKPRAQYPKQRHAFMGLLACGRCGCAMTAEKKKGKYIYYRCTGYRGACGNEYIREEPLADLLGTLIQRIEISPPIATSIAASLRESQADLERLRQQALVQATNRRSAVRAKLDRGYDDYVEGRISAGLWTRKSEDWEAELAVAEAEVSRLSRPTPAYSVTAEKILELAQTAHSRYLEQGNTNRRQLLDSVLSNCTFDRGTLCPTYVKPFDIFAEANETGNWRGGRDSNPRPPA